MLDDRLKDLEILFWIASDLRGVAFREGRVSGRLMYPGLSGALGRLVSAGLVKKIDMEHTASRDHYRVTKAGEVFVRSAQECYAEHIRGKADLRELEVLCCVAANYEGELFQNWELTGRYSDPYLNTARTGLEDAGLIELSLLGVAHRMHHYTATDAGRAVADAEKELYARFISDLAVSKKDI